MVITLIGGPCNGVPLDVGASTPDTGATLVCGGYLYRFDGGNRAYAVGPAPGAGDVGPVPGQRQVYLNWTRLMRAMAVTVPYHVRQSAKARARIPRIVK